MCDVVLILFKPRPDWFIYTQSHKLRVMTVCTNKGAKPQQK